ncbi:MAG: molybdenum ABC transporter ATP-binding protein, partial [Acidobacteria bacterium]|nr:molybdenum ABC transporter ATP-binding protein [Acidobacteriota bacterium]
MAGEVTGRVAPGLRPGALDLRACKRFGVAGESGFVLDVEFSAPPGITILFGPSGAGKTSVLDAVAGLTTPDVGHIVMGGRVFYDSAAGVCVPVAERGVGYVFQDLALFPHLSVEENIHYGIAALDAAERRRRTAAVLESFRIAHLASRRPDAISGGERQRVAVARALVTEPRVLLMDEPLSGLDFAVKSQIIADLRAWNARRPVPVLYATHDRGEVFALGERVVFLELGRIVAQGTPREVLEAPQRLVVAEASGFENIFRAAIAARHEAQGTMTCQLHGAALQLEVPLTRHQPGERVRVAVRAGDILLATAPPSYISARNVLAGRIVSLEQVDVTIIARVEAGGVEFLVHLTAGARESLKLEMGKEVWLVIKTYSCHLLLWD